MRHDNVCYVKVWRFDCFQTLTLSTSVHSVDYELIKAYCSNAPSLYNPPSLWITDWLHFTLINHLNFRKKFESEEVCVELKDSLGIIIHIIFS